MDEQIMTEVLGALKNVRMDLTKPGANASDAVAKQIELLKKRISTGKAASSLTADNEYTFLSAIAMLSDIISRLNEKNPEGAAAFKLIKSEFDSKAKELKKKADATGVQLSNVFRFCEEVFGDGQELLVLVTELTINYYSARFISRYGCPEYFSHNKELLFYERQKEIIQSLEELELEN
jgi:hypothetical protein